MVRFRPETTPEVLRFRPRLLRTTPSFASAVRKPLRPTKTHKCRAASRNRNLHGHRESLLGPGKRRGIAAADGRAFCAPIVSIFYATLRSWIGDGRPHARYPALPAQPPNSNNDYVFRRTR